ncbi:MAG: hypothetical protein PHQ90_11425 [Sulfuricurvum sp.]|uniref:hypothetical protein n=1 Tax=Sulfuricurvum sp. TaxID=2025608 RepID=UPI0026150FA9|nr:hypothetical protein [Sulfuricurvum sp.]MDD2369905.1 hypothetical protein [Sulfuricurvum sp.]MDD5118231.1 hypothetical protein [Sulfuricurvum sp.]
MKKLSGYWQEWTTPYSLELIGNGLLLGLFAGISEGTIIYMIMSAIGLFDTVLIFGK